MSLKTQEVFKSHRGRGSGLGPFTDELKVLIEEKILSGEDQVHIHISQNGNSKRIRNSTFASVGIAANCVERASAKSEGTGADVLQPPEPFLSPFCSAIFSFVYEILDCAFVEDASLGEGVY